MNVYHYFRATLGRWPTDHALTVISVDTDCGRQCKAAIDAASTFYDHVRVTSNDDPTERVTLIAITDRVVAAYLGRHNRGLEHNVTKTE